MAILAYDFKEATQGLDMSEDAVKELFTKIGSIAAKVDIVHERQIAIDSKLTAMSERDVRTDSAVKAAHRRIDETNLHIANDVLPVLKNHSTLRDKALGVLGFIGFILTGAGAFFVYILQKLGIVNV